jgi:hypothetical protein
MWLPFVAAAYNSTPQESTQRTPFELNFVDAPSIDPLQWAISKVPDGEKRGVSDAAERTIDELRTAWLEVRGRLAEVQAKQKAIADRHRRDVRYEVGDSVWLSTKNLQTHQGKLTDKWIGPYVVTKVGPSGASVTLDLRGDLGKVHSSFHVSLVRPYVSSVFDWPGREQANRPTPMPIDDQPEWEVEAIVGKKTELREVTVEEKVEAVTTRRGRVTRPATTRKVKKTVPVVMYRVRWRGWNEDDDTWQAETDLQHCRELVDEYELLQQRAESELSESSAVLELGVATVVRAREQLPSYGQTNSIVKLSFMGV